MMLTNRPSQVAATSNLKIHGGPRLLPTIKDVECNRNKYCIAAVGFKAPPTLQAVIAPGVRLHVQSSETVTHFGVNQS